RSHLINAWTSRKGRHLQDEISQTQPNHHFPPDSTAVRLWFSCHKTIYEIPSSLDKAVLREPKAVGNHWQVVEANAGGVKNGVTDRRRDRHDRCLARARRKNVFPIEQYGFDFRHVAEARHAIAR